MIEPITAELVRTIPKSYRTSPMAALSWLEGQRKKLPSLRGNDCNGDDGRANNKKDIDSRPGIIAALQAAHELTSKEIAGELGAKRSTVQNKLTTMFVKHEVKRRNIAPKGRRVEYKYRLADGEGA